MKCCRETDSQEIFGRTIKASIAKDNGRHTEFVKKKTYEDKTRCFECGDWNHLSYNCPKNLLGEREVPEKKERPFRKRNRVEENDSEEEQSEEDCKRQIEFHDQPGPAKSKTKYKKSNYFSDEEELDE